MPKEADTYIRIFLEHLVVNNIQEFKEFLSSVKEERRVFECGKELLDSQKNRLIQNREDCQRQYSLMLEKLDRAIAECKL